MQGFVILQYGFDLGGEVRIERLREKAKRFHARRLSERVLGLKWLQAGLGSAVLDLGRKKAAGEDFKVSAEIFEIGEAILKFEASAGSPARAEKLSDLLDDERLLSEANSAAAELLGRLKPFLHSEYPRVDFLQPYAIIALRARPARDKRWMTAVLRGVKNPSAQEVADSTRHSLSYDARDLAVIDYEAALLFDPDGDFHGIIDNIDVALVQLVALKTYDYLLDDRVLRMYETIKSIATRRASERDMDTALSEILEIRADVTDLIEDAVSITKVTGDWFFARVYAAAAERFKLDAWLANSRRKLDDLQDFHEVLSDKLEAGKLDRSNKALILLELIIVVLILVEIVRAV